MDPVAEHSKGSAFVKFEEKQSAEECLNKCNMDDGDDGNVSTQQLTFRNPRILSIGS